MAMLQGFSTEFDISFKKLLVLYNPQILCDPLNTENSLIPPWKPPAEAYSWEKEKKKEKTVDNCRSSWPKQWITFTNKMLAKA